MDFLVDAVLKILVALASTAVLALCGYGYKKIKSVRDEHVDLVKHLNEADDIKKTVKELEGRIQQLIDDQQPQNAALRETLGRFLDEDHGLLVDQRYASPKEKSAFERLYKAYHGLGGNGTRTALYKDVLQMKSYPME